MQETIDLKEINLITEYIKIKNDITLYFKEINLNLFQIEDIINKWNKYAISTKLDEPVEENLWITFTDDTSKDKIKFIDINILGNDDNGKYELETYDDFSIFIENVISAYDEHAIFDYFYSNRDRLKRYIDVLKNIQKHLILNIFKTFDF